jgi:hypothetical protein
MTQVELIENTNKHKTKTKIDKLLSPGSICIHYVTLRYTLHTTAIMPIPKSCIVCQVVASPDIQLNYCARCQCAVYCSEVCRKKDWKKQHKQICKLLNVGHGDM